MRISELKLRRTIRRVILEAKFSPSKPLDREDIQIALGSHPIQQLKNSEGYKKTQDEMIEFVRMQWEEDMQDDLKEESFVDIFEDYYHAIAHYYGSGTFNTEEYQMMFQDLLDDGELHIMQDGKVMVMNTDWAK